MSIASRLQAQNATVAFGAVLRQGDLSMYLWRYGQAIPSTPQVPTSLRATGVAATVQSSNPTVIRYQVFLRYTTQSGSTLEMTDSGDRFSGGTEVTTKLFPIGEVVNILTATVTPFPPPPVLIVNSSQLSFAIPFKSTSAATQINVSSSSGPLSFTATVVNTSGWLSVTPTTATTPANLNVTVNPIGLEPGTYTSLISLIPSNSSGGTRTISVTLSVILGDSPFISTNGVLNGASFTPGISAGSWITVFGQNFAAIPPPGRIWRDSEILNGVLPTSIEGVAVRINGKPGAIYFAGPSQLNVQVPDDSSLGYVTVEVSTPTGIDRATAEMRRFSPGLFVDIESQGRKYVAAVHSDGVIVGHPNLLLGTRVARSGDTIQVYGTGFGPTNPARPSGQVITGAPLANSFAVYIGGALANSLYGGLVGAGLYQFNIRIPDVASGDQPIVIVIGESQTQPGIFVPVQN